MLAFISPRHHERSRRSCLFVCMTVTTLLCQQTLFAAEPLTTETTAKGVSKEDLIAELKAANLTISEIRTRNEAPWGRPGDVVYCPAGSAAAGFRVKFEGRQGDGDDTAANGVELICRDVRTWTETARLRSAEGPWGGWSADLSCNSGDFIFGFQTRVEPHQGGGGADDTALNGIIMHCRPFGSTGAQPASQPRFDGIWGVWSGFSEARCSNKDIVMGIQSLVEPPQGRGTDDSALNAVRLYCFDVQ